MTENLHRANNFILLAGGAALIGFAPIFVRWSEMSPSWILFYRMLLTLPMLLLINLYFNKSFVFKVRSKKSIYIAFIAAFAFTIDLTLWHWSMTMTSISNSTIIVNSAPIFVALIYFLFFKESLNRHFFISLGVTYMGVAGLILSADTYTSGNLTGRYLKPNRSSFLCNLFGLYFKAWQRRGSKYYFLHQFILLYIFPSCCINRIISNTSTIFR